MSTFALSFISNTFISDCADAQANARLDYLFEDSLATERWK